MATFAKRHRRADGSIRHYTDDAHGTFGYFRFGEIATGQTAILTVKSKLFQFAPHVVSVTDSISDLDLSPIWQNLRKEF